MPIIVNNNNKFLTKYIFKNNYIVIKTYLMLKL